MASSVARRDHDAEHQRGGDLQGEPEHAEHRQQDQDEQEDEHGSIVRRFARTLGSGVASSRGCCSGRSWIPSIQACAWATRPHGARPRPAAGWRPSPGRRRARGSRVRVSEAGRAARAGPAPRSREGSGSGSRATGAGGSCRRSRPASRPARCPRPAGVTSTASPRNRGIIARNSSTGMPARCGGASAARASAQLANPSRIRGDAAVDKHGAADRPRVARRHLERDHRPPRVSDQDRSPPPASRAAPRACRRPCGRSRTRSPACRCGRGRARRT